MKSRISLNKIVEETINENYQKRMDNFILTLHKFDSRIDNLRGIKIMQSNTERNWNVFYNGEYLCTLDEVNIDFNIARRYKLIKKVD